VEKKIVTIKGIQTNVGFSGEGKPLLCLHGWEASLWSFRELSEALEGVSIQIIAPDLPGFGESSDPPEAWSVDDYADFVEELVKELDLKNVLLLGHSFGGRISIKLASRQAPWISHLYLCASAGVRHPEYWKRTAGVKIAEWGNAIFSLPGLRHFKSAARKCLYKLLRVHDYEKSKGINRETMIKVINEDLTPLLEKITAPTDLFWGEDDHMTPLADARLMNTKIAQSTLRTFPGVRHRVHRERAREVAEVIQEKL